MAVWHNAAPGDSQRLAEALRAGIGALGIPHGEGHVLTASGGFSEVIKPEPEHAARGISRDLFRRADDLLYKAKGAGRDRLVAG